MRPSLLLLVVAVTAFESCPTNFTCFRESSGGGCHNRDGLQNCTEAFTFGGSQDDQCITNPATGEVMCQYAYLDSGHVLPCKNATKDCPQRLEGTLCSLVPSGGGEWCVDVGTQCTLSPEQANHCVGGERR